jgi:hypothetical protein
MRDERQRRELHAEIARLSREVVDAEARGYQRGLRLGASAVVNLVETYIAMIPTMQLGSIAHKLVVVVSKKSSDSISPRLEVEP